MAEAAMITSQRPQKTVKKDRKVKPKGKSDITCDNQVI
jgi:hypothetical protein